ncbi:MAG TPA: alpha/beta hydrolase [Amnibacterium sp.]|jgi:pimeloyl-ACP methyl ester carboxylesterase|uniref:alpha/beta fold hydrolase n=1 Tax=Amnibacterium sp. TaxID=1872496 RepID=UPI002F93C87C
MAGTRIRAASGRMMGLFGTGDPIADRLVLMCHPTPGSGSFDPDPTVTSRWGVHLAGLDRPGYGATDALDDPADASMRELVEDLASFIEYTMKTADTISKADYTQVGLIGWGTGAAVAASLAERHPERIDRLAIVSAPAERDIPKAARRALIAPHSIEALHVDPADPALDSRLGLRNRLERMVDEAYLQGKAGIEADRYLMADASWSRDLGAIRAKTALFFGEQDSFADGDDAAWWQQQIPGATLSLSPRAGHLVLATEWEAILQHVAPNHGDVAEDQRDHGHPVMPRL